MIGLAKGTYAFVKRIGSECANQWRKQYPDGVIKTNVDYIKENPKLGCGLAALTAGSIAWNVADESKKDGGGIAKPLTKEIGATITGALGWTAGAAVGAACLAGGPITMLGMGILGSVLGYSGGKGLLDLALGEGSSKYTNDDGMQQLAQLFAESKNAQNADKLGFSSNVQVDSKAELAKINAQINQIASSQAGMTA